MFAIASLPNATTTLASIGEWSAPLFEDLLPFAIMALGIGLAVFVVRFLINSIIKK